MQSRFMTVLALITLMCTATCTALAAPRTVLLEGFTQWNCPPCASWNPHEHEVYEAMGTDTVVVIKYHMSWPDPNDDPMHLWNTTESLARRSLYAVTSVPKGFLNGRNTILLLGDGSGRLLPDTTKKLLRNTIRNLKANPAPCWIELFNETACSGTPTTVDFEGIITASGDSALSNVQLFAALLYKSYYVTGGNNGETTFPHVFRDMWPNTSGQTISVSAGGSREFSGTLDKDASWDPNDLEVVIFIQTTATRWMHQSAVFPVREMWGMTASSENPRQVLTNPNEPTTVSIVLANTGCDDDVFTVRLSGHLTLGWTRTIEAPGTGANPDSIQVAIPFGSQETLQMYVHPNDHPGMAMSDIIISSQGNPSVQTVENFRALTNVDAIIIDDDGGSSADDVDDYYFSMLSTAIPAGMSWAVWDATKGNVTNPLLSTPHLVIWYTSVNGPGNSISFSEQNMLAGVMDRGGSVFLTGENIVYDLRSSLFMPNYLHARFAWIYSQAQNVDGVAGDPISDGLQFAMRGGDGSDNHTRPSAITAADEQATVIWEYSGSQYHAGVRVQGTNYRAVLMGFGIEAIDNQADRDSVMTRTLRWLAEGLDAEPRPVITPYEFSLGSAYPNPFNPSTTIPYTLAERSEVSLLVFDILGREVAALAAGMKDAGTHRAYWKAADLPSGLYFCRLEAVAGTQSFRATQKIMLLK